MTARNLPPRAVGYREAVAKAREAMAEELFRPDDVFAALAAAATRGETFYIIRPAAPFNLKETEAAKKLEQLSEKEGLQFLWTPIEHPRGLGEDPYFELVIRWM